MGARNLVGDKFWIGGPKPQVTKWEPNLKTTEIKVSTGWKAEFLPKIKLRPKKDLNGLRTIHQPNLVRILKTTSRFGNKFFIGCKAIGGGWAPCSLPPATSMNLRKFSAFFFLQNFVALLS